jgi:hypothetical protein
VQGSPYTSQTPAGEAEGVRPQVLGAGVCKGVARHSDSYTGHTQSDAMRQQLQPGMCNSCVQAG